MHDFEVGTQEYVVTDIPKVRQYIDRHIGVDYEITTDEVDILEGSIVVFELLHSEHKLIRDFISQNNLWRTK